MLNLNSNGDLPNSELYYLMASDNTGTCYEPIVDVETGGIFAWEALARFIGSGG